MPLRVCLPPPEDDFDSGPSVASQLLWSGVATLAFWLVLPLALRFWYCVGECRRITALKVALQTEPNPDRRPVLERELQEIDRARWRDRLALEAFATHGLGPLVPATPEWAAFFIGVLARSDPDDTGTHQVALAALRRMGPQALPALCDCPPREHFLWRHARGLVGLLVGIGPQAVPDLLRVFLRGEEGTFVAGEALLGIVPEGPAALRDCLANPATQAQTVASLRRIADGCVPFCIESLGDDREAVRVAVVVVLSAATVKQAHAGLRLALADRSPTIRQEALGALRFRLDGDEAVAVFLAGTADADPEVRATALWLLRWRPGLEDPRTLRAAVWALFDPERMVRGVALRLLADWLAERPARNASRAAGRFLPAARL